MQYSIVSPYAIALVRAVLCGAAVIAVAALSTCTRTVAGSEVTNEDAIALVGRVVDENGAGVAGIDAKASNSSLLSDTTDADGKYTIRISAKEYIERGLDTTALEDSIRYYKDDFLVASRVIQKWRDTLDDVVVSIRNVSGALARPLGPGYRLEAIITSHGDTASEVRSEELWYNSANTSYSGLVSFRYTSKITDYSLYVNVINQSGRLAGRSATISSIVVKAGDIDIPTFDPENAKPYLHAGADTSVRIGDTLRIAVVAGDSFGGAIVGYAWKADGAGQFDDKKNDSTFSFASPVTWNDTAIAFIVRAIDNDSNASFDTVTVRFFRDVPTVAAAADSVVDVGDTLTIVVSARDSVGTIVKWDYILSKQGMVPVDTIVKGPFERVYSFFAASLWSDSLVCTVRATNDIGSAGSASRAVLSRLMRTITHADTAQTVCITPPSHTAQSMIAAGNAVSRVDIGIETNQYSRWLNDSISLVIRVRGSERYRGVRYAEIGFDGWLIYDGMDVRVAQGDTIVLEVSGTMRDAFRWKSGPDCMEGSSVYYYSTEYPDRDNDCRVFFMNKN